MRAWDVFQWALAIALIVALAAMGAASLLRLFSGPLDDRQARALLAALYWGVYPAAFIAFGALFWHFVSLYSGRLPSR